MLNDVQGRVCKGLGGWSMVWGFVCYSTAQAPIGSPRFHSMWLVFSPVALVMGFLKMGKPPDPCRPPQHPPTKHIHTPLVSFSVKLHFGVSAGLLWKRMLSLRTGVSHLHDQQCEQEIFIPLSHPPPLQDPTVTGLWSISVCRGSTVCSSH